METTVINGREYKVEQVENLLGSAINKVNPKIIASVLLTGKRGAAKMAYKLKDGSFDVVCSL